MWSGVLNGPPGGWAALPAGPGLAGAGGEPLAVALAVGDDGLAVVAGPPPQPARRPPASSTAPQGPAVASSSRAGWLELGRCALIMAYSGFWPRCRPAAAVAEPQVQRRDDEEVEQRGGDQAAENNHRERVLDLVTRPQPQRD